MTVNTLGYNIFVGLLRVALVAALVGAGWNIYRHLPGGKPVANAGQQSQTALQIVLRRGPTDTSEPLSIPVKLYSVDVDAIRREYRSELRPGMRFDDFLARRLKNHPSVTSELDRGGQTVIMVAPGKWLIYALLSGDQNVEWRLTVDVAGRRQTVELTPENAYARMKTF